MTGYDGDGVSCTENAAKLAELETKYYTNPGLNVWTATSIAPARPSRARSRRPPTQRSSDPAERDLTLYERI